MRTRNPSQQTIKGQRLEDFFPPVSLPPVKNAFIMEAETVNARYSFMIKEVA